MLPALALLTLLITSAGPSDLCPVTSDAWIELSSVPDSVMVPPQFFFDKPTVPVEAIIICEHGVFFNFHAKQDGAQREYYLSCPVPTREEYRRYVPPDTMLSPRAAMNPKYIDDYVDRRVAAAAKDLNQLKAGLNRLLADKYVEGKRIDLTGTSARLDLGYPLTVMWEKEKIPFGTLPGIYWRR